MEDRATSVILLLSLLILAYNLTIKVQFVIFNWVLYGGMLGLYFFWTTGLFIRKMDTQIDILTNPGNTHTGCLNSISFRLNKFYYIAGVIYGSYVGYNLSIIYTTYYSLRFAISFSFLINSLAGIFTSPIVIAFENSRLLRSFLPFVYPETQPWTIFKFTISLYVTLVIGEYVGLMGMVYLGVFEMMYYLLYTVTILFGWWFAAIGCLGCLGFNFMVGLIQEIRRRRYKLEKEPELEQDTANTSI